MGKCLPLNFAAFTVGQSNKNLIDIRFCRETPRKILRGIKSNWQEKKTNNEKKATTSICDEFDQKLHIFFRIVSSQPTNFRMEFIYMQICAISLGFVLVVVIKTFVLCVLCAIRTITDMTFYRCFQVVVWDQRTQSHQMCSKKSGKFT